jgi:glycosyltransferase involved in cell wall biosynthesis
MQRPRLLLLVPATEYHQHGGAESAVTSYAAMASAWGFEVLIATTKPKGSTFIQPPDNHLLIEGWPTYYSDGIVPLETSQALRRLVEATQPHIIHALSIGTLGLLTTIWPSERPFALLFSYFETPYQWPALIVRLSEIHTPDLHYLKDPWKWYSNVARNIVAKSHIDAFVPFSDLYREWGYSVLGVSKTLPCVTAPHVVDEEQPQGEAEWPAVDLAPSRYVVVAARAVPRKGILSLLQSVRRYSQAKEPIHILMTDPRPNDGFHTRFRQQIYSLAKNAKHVTILPANLRREELTRLYKGASFVLYPSLHEGYGLVPLEAARVGCPTIGFDIPGTRHSLVQCGNGWRVNCYDWKSLIQLADRVWENQLSPDLRITRDISTWVTHQQLQAGQSWHRVHQLLVTLQRVSGSYPY